MIRKLCEITQKSSEPAWEGTSSDWWIMPRTGIDMYRMHVEEFERACIEARRDPATVRRSWYGGCVCGQTEAAVKKLNTNNYIGEKAFLGTPAQLIEQMQQFVDLGVDYFMLQSGGFPDLTTLELLVSEVMPALNR